MALAAVEIYFDGEQRTMMTVLVSCAFLSVMVLGLYVLSSAGFAEGLMITVVLGAAILSGVALSMMNRDIGLRKQFMLMTSLKQDELAVNAEKERISVLIKRIPYYRSGGVTVGLLALLMVLLMRQPQALGVAAGLLMMTSMIVGIEFYTEKRAMQYYYNLEQATATET